MKEDISVIRRDMERILLHKPDRMLIFITAEMRNMLSELLQNEWAQECEMCTLVKLSSFGFCQWTEDEDAILVPAPVKEIYSSKLRVSGKKDKIVKTAEAFLKRCGVMEMQLLHSAVVRFLKCKISYEEFDYLIYSRLHYFGMYYWNRYGETEYMSCYDAEMTQKILAERQKPENAAFDYPDFGNIYAEKGKEIPDALKNGMNMSILI